MAITPKIPIPLTKGLRTKIFKITGLSTSYVSLYSTFKALGVSASGFWLAVDSAAANTILIGDNAAPSSTLELAKGADIWFPTMADDVWVASSAATTDVVIVCVGT